MSNEQLNALLYRKLETEQRNYKRWLMEQPPEVILENAYKYAMREDVLLCFEDNDLPDNLARALLRSSEPLEKIFATWEASGTGHMDSIWEKAQKYAAQLAQRASKAQQKVR
jgi:hypothetical protein